MRRRRQVLQVSTFPFLAVLLCAMGSLILLLLVIDRRAKVVARSKALEAVRQAAVEDEKVIAARRAEWEQRRQALHQQLDEENGQVRANLRSLQGKMEMAARDTEKEQGSDRAFQEQIQAETTQLRREEEQLAARTRSASQLSQQSEALQTERARLTSDLRKLEIALEDLKTLRQRQQQTYSLVPYRGKQGDNRRPLYLECAANGAVFHPERRTVPVDEASQIRSEVERRLAERLPLIPSPHPNPAPPVGGGQGEGQGQGGGLDSGKEQTAYVLFLIRPNGIVTYYQALAALVGLKVDFGYEFVDQDWVLDFPRDDKMPAPQSWMTAASNASGEVQTKPQGKIADGKRAIHGIPPRSGSFAGNFTSEIGSEMIREPTRLGGTAQGGNRDEAGVRLGMPGNASPTSPPPWEGRGERLGTGVVASPSQVGAISPGLPGVPIESASLKRGTTSAVGSNPLQRVRDKEGDPGSKPESELDVPRSVRLANPNNAAANASVASSPSARSVGALVPNDQGVKTLPEFSLSTADGPRTNRSLSPSAPLGKGDEPVMDSSGPGRVFTQGSSPDGQKLSGGTNLSLSHAPGSQGDPYPLTPTFSPGGERGKEGEEGTPPEPSGSSGTGPASLLESGPPSERLNKRPTSLPSVRRWVNRDWSIFVECRGDGVVLYPGGLQIAASKLLAKENPLAIAVQQIIARRQAIIGQAAEPLGQPRVCFLVRPDGLRSYYQAYPELQRLRLPMTRENLEADDDITRHLIAR